jgi:cellulose biosynthesis protein BcsQ
MRTVALFNNQGGVGKTTLAYHLAHMLSRLGYPAVAVDLDPQANLTSAFFDEERLETLWDEGGETILACVNPILEGTGDIREPVPLEVADSLWVLAGDLGLSRFEDKLSDSWPRGYNNDQAALRTTSAFHRIIRRAAKATGAVVALLDVGPNLGAINRAALLAADFLVIPLAADLFSLQGLKNLGPTVRTWRQQWNRLQDLVSTEVELPPGEMTPAGYVVLQHAVRLDRPVRAYGRWLDRIPAVYREAVLGEKPAPKRSDGNDNEHCLATLHNFRSLMPMAQDARKPMFDLRPADGAIGSHAQLAQTCADEFRRLADHIAKKCDLRKPQ